MGVDLEDGKKKRHTTQDDRNIPRNHHEPEVKDIYNLDRGNGIFGRGASDGIVNRRNIGSALNEMDVRPEVRRSVMDSIPTNATLSVSEATKIVSRAVQKSDLIKFGQPSAPQIAVPVTDNRITALNALNEVLPDPTTRYGLANLNTALNQADNGKGTGLFNISGKHDGFLGANEIIDLIEHKRGHTMLMDERKAIKKELGDRGIDIDHLLKSVADQTRDNPKGPINPIRLEQDPLIASKLNTGRTDIH